MSSKHPSSPRARSGQRLLVLTLALTMMLIGNIPAASANLQTVSVGAQVGAVTSGTAGSVTYTVTVTRNSGSPNTTTPSVSGLPAGATATFGTQSSWSSATGNGTRTIPLTVSVSTAVAAGSHSFNVQVSGQGPDPTGSGTLTVSPAPVAQTITLSPLVDKAMGDPDFDVSASASSGLTVSFAAAGDCSIAGTLVHLLAAGSCTITASQAGNASYLPAPDVPQSFAITQGTPTVTFAAAPAAWFPGPDFTVAATTNSDGAVTYAYVSGPCSLVDANAGTFSPTGVGDCLVQADTAATTNYAAATEQLPVSITEPPIELYAVAGSTTLGGQATTVWGYGYTAASATKPGGPTIVVNQDDVVSIALHNGLSEDTGLLIGGQSLVPDSSGVAAGGTRLYSFTATNPGTFLYEAAALPHAQHQVAMGLYGALVVLPTTAGQAYAASSSAFDDEAVLVLSEIDPALNNKANPATFDMRDYKPRYFLINGEVYPNTTSIATDAGNTVLLRYLNAGNQYHSMAVLGAHQTVIAYDGNPLTYSHDVVAETFGPGQTTDVLVDIPVTATAGSLLAVYDGSLQLHSSNNSGFGGMLTFLEVGGTPPTGDLVGPLTSGVVLTSTSVAANISDAGRGDSDVTAAEYFLDATGTNGSGQAVDPFAAAITVAVNGTIAPALTGTHTLYVHGQDTAGNWGPFASANISIDVAGPTTTALGLAPDPTNGTTAVTISATANDTATGGSNIAAAEYTLDGGTPIPMTVTPSGAKVANVTGSISSVVINGLLEGAHSVSVRSQDSLGNWGGLLTRTLTVDKTGPATSGVTAAPNPNNGTVGINSSTPAVRVTAVVDDTGPATSGVTAVEGFIDTVGANGAGIVFLPVDGSFGSSPETAQADIPLATISALSEGSHTIYVHGKDLAGNWGSVSSTVLVIDKTAPVVTNVTLTPSTVTLGTASVSLAVTATDAVSAITSGQYWVDGTATPPAGAITFTSPATVNTSALAGGTHTVFARVRDAAGNWSAVSSATLLVVQAVNDTRAITANGSSTQTSDLAAPGVLANDQPIGAAGRTTALTTAPVRTSGNGNGTITLSCPGSLGTAGPTVGGNTICTNGAYRATLNGVGNNNNQRASSKRGTFQFTYTLTLNGVTSTATVVITVG